MSVCSVTAHPTMSQLLKTLSTIAVFLSLSAAGWWTIEGHFFRSEPGAYMFEHTCPAHQIPSQYRYTYMNLPDRLICMLGEFFKVLFSPSHSSYTIHFLTGFSAEVAIFLIEGTRSDKSWLSNPLVMGIVYQTLGAGSTIPLSLLIIILSSKGRARQPLTKPEAESILIVVIFGYLLPSLWMFLTLDPKVMVLWQTFPVWQSHMQTLYLAIRPKTTMTGLHTLKLALGATFLSSLFIHLIYLQSIAAHSSVSAFLDWWPSWTLPDPKSATIESTAYHLIKWDSILSYSACIMAGCSFAATWSEMAIILGLAPFSSALVSPGAYISLLWVYREWKLNQNLELNKCQSGELKERRERVTT